MPGLDCKWRAYGSAAYGDHELDLDKLFGLFSC
jgi:hypothetical protein